MSLIVRRIGLLGEKDVKKLIAYSTIRHVSLIMFILRFGLVKVVYFHLNIHALFKSTVFMCFGFVILYSYHGQDQRIVVVGIVNPFLFVIYEFSVIILIGLPFLRGFFSKDLIIEKVIDERSR